VAAVARQALRDAMGPTSLAVRQTLRIRHLLVDEFQDTSLDQLDLLRSLVEGWDANDGRSLFVVGDPMQSIYLFRHAEVGLFLQVRSEGVGAVQLESQTLTRNFRSLPALIEWSNREFPSVFPAREDLRSSAVRFLAADAARGALEGSDAAVAVWAQPTPDAITEARQIAAEITQLRGKNPRQTVAVLLQTRASATALLDALRAAELPTVAVDLASLGERAIVRDLVALAQALLHPLDRSAWLSVLRAPYCGLTLHDLEQLGAQGMHNPVLLQVSEASIVGVLSSDAQQRLHRVAPILQRAWDARGQCDFSTLLEITWRQLGGPQCTEARDDIDAAHRYLLALRRALEAGQTLDATQLAQIAAQLRDRGETPGDNPVEVMTIHRAKGLEWDVVFLPGLGRTVKATDSPLLRWLQLPAAGGQQDLLMAVRSLGEPNASDDLARYVRQLQAQRERHEKIRLLYVAVTRARDRLILSGHAPIAKKTALCQPRRNTLLELLWPAVHTQFGQPAPATEAPPTAAAQAGRSPPSAAAWRRVAADFALPITQQLPSVVSLARSLPEATERLEFSWVGPLARAVGTVVHGELERLALQPTHERERLNEQLPHYVNRLRELGLAADAALPVARQIASQLQAMLHEATLQWLLDTAHRDAHSEWALSGLVEGELRSVVIDRSFVDADGVRWVIDYKHSAHSYTPQLQLYVRLAQRMGVEPVRAALYFTQLRQLVELPTTLAAV
jgi:ATP-dependent helicase/nuclease subunit A